MTNHDFHKLNLVTTSKGDLYECTVCKASGYRMGFNESILLTDKMFNVAEKCSFKNGIFKIGELANRVIEKVSNEIKRPKKVLTYSIPVEGGVDEGIHDVVPCPPEYLEKYSNDIWILSEKGVPVRVMPHEIVDREF